MATTPKAARTQLIAGLKRWKLAADKATQRAAAAKKGLRTAKAELRQARKTSKAAKKAAKEARKKVEATQAALQATTAAARTKAAAREKGPRASKAARAAGKSEKSKAAAAKAEATAKPKAGVTTPGDKPQAVRPSTAKPKPAPKRRHSAAEVARSVIKRLGADKRRNGESVAGAPASERGETSEDSNALTETVALAPA